MGNFYTNYTVRGRSQQEVAAALSGRNAIVTSARNNCVVVYDEQSDTQDPRVLEALGAKLSRDLQSPVLTVLNHDDDILWYQLHLNGNSTDEYNSCPGYFEGEDTKPSGGHPKKLCEAFNVDAIEAVQAILHENEYDFALERHQSLCAALEIPSFAAGAGFTYVKQGEIPEGLDEEDLVEVTANR